MTRDEKLELRVQSALALADRNRLQKQVEDLRGVMLKAQARYDEAVGELKDAEAKLEAAETAADEAQAYA